MSDRRCKASASGGVLGARIVDGKTASDRASGIDIWTGIGCSWLGLGMLVWMPLSPSVVAGPPLDSGRRSTER